MSTLEPAMVAEDAKNGASAEKGTKRKDPKDFDYRALRFFVGVLAIALPILVRWFSSTPLTSVSGSYYTESRDVFVGTLFALSILLLAYHGHNPSKDAGTFAKLLTESRLSTVGAVAMLCVALYPTSCNGCPTASTAGVHYIAAIVVFGILAFFCFVPFRDQANKKKKDSPKARWRAYFYAICGVLIVVCSLGILVVIQQADPALKSSPIIYFLESGALWAFGWAWFVAAKVRFVGWFVTKDEAYDLWSDLDNHVPES